VSDPEPLTYLTDGKGLWRFEMRCPDGNVLLEDCRLNRSITVDGRRFRKLGLRPVVPLQKGTEGLVGSRDD
jgi:hypothetical protein